jgi:hypothetical protein
MTRIGSRKSFDLEWIERWARQVNDDRILPVIGRFFNGKFVLGVDETDYLIEQVPPPMFNDIWAMAHPLHGHLRIDGNTLPFWQNLRALTRMLSLMRQV